MLDDFNIPSFHASELVNRDIISDSRFKGWDFADETRLFTRAVDIICDKRYCAVMWPIGCSVSLAGNRDWIATPDTAWKLLFVRLFMAVLEKYPAQNGISFMFDDKPEVRSYVDRFYRPAREAINEVWPGKIYGDEVRFGDDELVEPLQAADLFAYEWRRRISERALKPAKPPRTAYKRLREARPDGAVHHYNNAAVEAIGTRVTQGIHFVNAMLECPSTEE